MSKPGRDDEFLTEQKESTENGSGAAAPGNSILHGYEQRVGRVVLDPEEAKIEFGETVAAQLKLSKDKTKVLWPQPTDDPEDPQNWSNQRKSLHLFIITLAAIVPDFDSGIGIATLFQLAKQFDTSTRTVNDLTSTWSIFLIGWGSLFAVMLMRRYGRLPVLFWSQLLALGFLVGNTFAPEIKTFAAMRCLTAFFGTCPQVTGLYIVTDMYPFHLQARKLNIWTMGFVVSPHLSPFAFGFLAARASWRWSYGIGCIYGAVVLLLIVLLMEETMYDRNGTLQPSSSPGIRRRFKTLVGITGFRSTSSLPSWSEVVIAPFRVIWRPHVFSILVFEAMVFGFGIGINVTNSVFFGSPPPVGFGFDQFAIAGIYGTPIVAVAIGELMGRFVNDWIMNISTRRNKGVFEAESRLWACYFAMPLYLAGFIVIGAALQERFSKAAIIIGWALAEIAVMINTTAVYAYCNDCFPDQQGEISALLNLARTLGGFGVAFFQVPWASKHGALQTFGLEGTTVIGLFALIIPLLQLRGGYLRRRFSIR